MEGTAQSMAAISFATAHRATQEADARTVVSVAINSTPFIWPVLPTGGEPSCSDTFKSSDLIGSD